MRHTRCRDTPAAFTWAMERESLSRSELSRCPGERWIERRHHRPGNELSRCPGERWIERRHHRPGNELSRCPGERWIERRHHRPGNTAAKADDLQHQFGLFSLPYKILIMEADSWCRLSVLLTSPTTMLWASLVSQRCNSLQRFVFRETDGEGGVWGG
ncbi:hypothetical protein RRG08_038274 [Elysia crispata]|uniref:Uncharacterized protein n=1 Tax=Elysia crispata TaxID=231223 RepID=A0AAE1E2T8_9GAST|nr:hypothetical protein RRG08_038274 [Elysia crispata]